MKKLLKKAFKKNIPVRDPIAVLIARLTDPTDPIYDENFTKGMNQLADCITDRK
jgi:hypothetical protein